MPGFGDFLFPVALTSEFWAGEPGKRALSFPSPLADFPSEDETTTEGGRALRPRGVPGREGVPEVLLPLAAAEACTACIAGEGLIALLEEEGGKPFLATGGPAGGFSLEACAAVISLWPDTASELFPALTSDFVLLSSLSLSLGGDDTATVGTTVLSSFNTAGFGLGCGGGGLGGRGDTDLLLLAPSAGGEPAERDTLLLLVPASSPFIRVAKGQPSLLLSRFRSAC